MNNMYWPIYMNLENEVLDLANRIHFSDDQVKVYSIYIADLIVRAATEIESISKELYKEIGGNMEPTDEHGERRTLYFDTDCINLLEEEWKLSKKHISVSAINMFFEKQENIVLAPLYKANKRGSSGSKWKRAYQALKHDRNNSLSIATISNLINILGALYILNLYYRDDQIDLGRVYMNETIFDSRMGSNLFSAKYFHASPIAVSRIMNDSSITPFNIEEFENSIFIQKYDDKSFEAMHESFCKDDEITMRNFEQSKIIKDFLLNNPEFTTKSVVEICKAAGGDELILKTVCLKHSKNIQSLRQEVILNKHRQIYPNLSYES